MNGPYTAIQRAILFGENLASDASKRIIVSMDGNDVALTAKDLLIMRVKNNLYSTTIRENKDPQRSLIIKLAIQGIQSKTKP